MQMTDEAVRVHLACQALVTRYCHDIDLGRAARVADLFTVDGVWESPEQHLDGQQAIRDVFGRRQASARRSRHVCSTFALTEVTADSARGITYFTLYRTDEPGEGPAKLPGPTMVGHYDDTFRRTDDGWRIAHRLAVAAFVF
jgi:hypothetical protein